MSTTMNEYAPITDDQDVVVETFQEYQGRIAPQLPNFPDDVLEQLWFEHPLQTWKWDWLAPKLEFKLQNLPRNEVPAEGFGGEAVFTYLSNHKEGRSNRRLERIESYFEQHGTWPRPPIFLNNPEGTIVSPTGFKCACPVQIMEGHNRLAIFLLYLEMELVGESHTIWCARRVDT